MASPPQFPPGSGISFDSIQKYHVIVEAEGAGELKPSYRNSNGTVDNLQLPSGHILRLG